MKAGDPPFRRFLLILAVWAGVEMPAIIPSAWAEEVDSGARLYEEKCGGCHALDADRIGPRHRGVVGRRAGGISGFPYSPAVSQSTIVWTPQTLDRWLTDPEALIPGQRMNFRVGDAAVRNTIIAFLSRQKPGL